MGRLRNKKKIIRYLLYLAVVTTIVTSATLAKYSTMAEFGVTGTVAAFVSGTTVDLNMALDDMAPGSAKNIQFTVVNYEGDQTSDVSLDYEILVSSTGNLPLAFSLLGEKESADSDAGSRLVGVLTQTEDGQWKADGGKLPIASQTGGRKKHTYRLTASWPASAEAADYSQEIDMLTVTVVTRQSPTTTA